MTRRSLFSGAFLLLGCRRPPPLPTYASWDEKTGTFQWGLGKIRVPVGFKYRVGDGEDTFHGSFTSPDRTIVVEHDIGSYAGNWTRRERAIQFEELIQSGSRVWIATRGWPDAKGGQSILAAVTFPDADTANFYIEHAGDTEIALIKRIAQSFEPIQK